MTFFLVFFLSLSFSQSSSRICNVISITPAERIINFFTTNRVIPTHLERHQVVSKWKKKKPMSRVNGHRAKVSFIHPILMLPAFLFFLQTPLSFIYCVFLNKKKCTICKKEYRHASTYFYHQIALSTQNLQKMDLLHFNDFMES